MEQVVNYQKQLDSILTEIKELGSKPRLLLHACCGPCSTYVIEYLTEFFDITIYFYNPNIHPKEEYIKRLETIKKFIQEFPLAVQNKIQFVEEHYDPEEYFAATGVREQVELQTEPERGERCRRCYEFRMKKSWEYAEQNGFEYFTTTISISPCKDAKKINEIGLALKSEKGLKYLVADFKKKNGFKRSLELCREFKLYRQNYCGCIYSKNNTPDCEGKSSHQCVFAL